MGEKGRRWDTEEEIKERINVDLGKV